MVLHSSLLLSHLPPPPLPPGEIFIFAEHIVIFSVSIHQNLIGVWLVLHSCLLLSYLPPRLPEKSSSLVFTASCEDHETTKQEAANLVIYDANSLSMAFSSFNITIALYIYSFAFLPLYHLIFHLQEKFSTSQFTLIQLKTCKQFIVQNENDRRK